MDAAVAGVGRPGCRTISGEAPLAGWFGGGGHRAVAHDPDICTHGRRNPSHAFLHRLGFRSTCAGRGRAAGRAAAAGIAAAACNGDGEVRRHDSAGLLGHGTDAGSRQPGGVLAGASHRISRCAWFCRVAALRSVPVERAGASSGISLAKHVDQECIRRISHPAHDVGGHAVPPVPEQ